MIKVTLWFNSEGERIKRVALLKNDMTGLSKSKLNQASDYDTSTWIDGYWFLVFDYNDVSQFEVDFYYNFERHRPMLQPIKAITWRHDVIVDVQAVTEYKVSFI